ncbi:MAG: hypothetical protein IAE91_14580 [Ignavibacteriaceae bacterium]|nr:hypothetical protein [Ignavibacteriaceae bacterium]
MSKFNREDLPHLITAFADNEIHDKEIAGELESVINTNSDAKSEFVTQIIVKKTIKKKCTRVGCPEQLRQQILDGIKPRERKSAFLDFIYSLLTKPSYAFASLALVIIFSVSTLYLLRQDTPVTGNLPKFDKMALTNFNLILEGKLAPQITTDDIKQVEAFFASNGVDYDVPILCPDNWKLLGGVVSEDGGQKLAHYVFQSPQGKLMYLFDADQKYFTSNRVLDLDENVMKTVQSGNCFVVNDSNVSLIINKKGNNIRAIASNEKSDLILSYFCNKNI